MSAPPLAPELWNCGAVAVIVGLCAWSVRLLRLALRLLDARYAVHQEATVHLRELGPSLSVLQNASMWHLQQLLRTKKEATAADMARVRVPFDVPASSIRLLRAAGERALALAVGVRCADSCAVQVLWNVRVDALERPHHRHHAVSTDCSDGHKMRVPQLPRGVFRRLGMGNSIRASPWVLSPVRRQTRRHRLNDDKVAESPNDLDTATLARFLVDPSAYSSQSCVETFEEGGSHEFTAHVPAETLFAPHAAEEASLAQETECDDAKDALATSSDSPDSEPRYGAVIVVGPASLLDSDAKTSRTMFSWRASSWHRKRSVEAEATEEAVLECIAVDFLPTPAKAERFAPSVVKRLVLTPSSAYSMQDIFGRDAGAGTGGECVICLEGPLAALLLPCRHLCVCRVCLEEIDRCPICRAKFSTYVCYAEEPADGPQELEVKVVDPL